MRQERSVLTQLRDVVPLRPLTQSEAEHVAELQATRLLELTGVIAPPVPEQVVSELPRFCVRRLSPLASSGRTEWMAGAWHIFLNAAEPCVRQRFSLFHEFKHALDHPFVDCLYPKTGRHDGKDRAERICDHFAACVLMPKVWVVRAYCDERVQELRRLARGFGVSQAAMNIRLQVLGLVDPVPRCEPYRRESDALTAAASSPAVAGLQVLQSERTAA